MTRGVYLIHFTSPVKYDKASQYGDEQHYVGVAENIESRIFDHISANGAEMTKAAVLQGIGLSLSAVFHGDISAKRERYVQKNVREFCLTCRMAEETVEKIEKVSKETSIKKLLADTPIKQEKVEWATPFTLRYGDHCKRCGKVLPADTNAAILSNRVVCLNCVRPEERGTKIKG